MPGQLQREIVEIYRPAAVELAARAGVTAADAALKVLQDGPAPRY